MRLRDSLTHVCELHHLFADDLELPRNRDVDAVALGKHRLRRVDRYAERGYGPSSGTIDRQVAWPLTLDG
jgi:hypothetical protein